MTHLFTVKLDLSDITHDEREKLYVLMVDPVKMKIIFQFKLWIRFLFSINSPIKLMYEGAAIHDLEDVQILTLLKTVRVECVDCVDEEREQQQDLFAKLSRYNQWLENVTPAVTHAKQCEVMKWNGSQIPLPELDASNKSDSPNKVHQGRNDRTLHDGACNSSESESKGVNSAKSTKHLNSSPCNSSLSYIHHNGSNENKCHSQRDGFSTLTQLNGGSSNASPKITNESGKVSYHTIEKESSAKKRAANKPFSLYNFIQRLRMQEANDDDGSNKADVHETESDKNISFNASSMTEPIQSTSPSEDVGEGYMMKKKRKRIRKHKNQKNKYDIDLNNTMQMQITPKNRERPRLKSSSQSPKPKHIRFEEDGGSSQDSGSGKLVQDGEITLNGEENNCNNYYSQTESSDNQNCEVSSVIQESNLQNGSNKFFSATVKVIDETESRGNIDVDESNSQVNGENKAFKNGSSSENPESLLSIFETLKSKSKATPVFDRFASCM